MKWYTADTHFGHKRIISYQKRPFLVDGDTYDAPSDESVHRMTEELIDRWNQRVGHDDIIYHLGDFAFLPPTKAAAILERLNGRKYLISGNHDNHGQSNLLGWVKSTPYLEVRDNDELIILSHFPFLTWNKAHRGSLHFHGHSHGSQPSTDQRIDVGVDCWDWYPVNFEMISERLMKSPKHRMSDYHGR